MSNVIEYRGLDELIALMRQFPQKLKKISKVGMQASLLALWENVPPYPVVDNPTRTGTLGRTLGSSEAGGNSGAIPSIYEIKTLGSGFTEGRFGTNLEYAPYVIGEQQAWFHYRWWRLIDIIPLAQQKIIAIWNGIANEMAKFLNSRSSGVK